MGMTPSPTKKQAQAPTSHSAFLTALTTQATPALVPSNPSPFPKVIESATEVEWGRRFVFV